MSIIVVPHTYEEAIRTLAGWHGALDAGDLEIYSIPDPCKTEVRLIEVSDDFPSTGEIMAVSFGASAEFPFRSSTALITRKEWQRALSGELPLPGGWDLSRRLRVLPREGV